MPVFNEALEVGKKIEYRVLSWIQQKYQEAFIMEGNFKYFDIYIPEIDKRVEVKKDEKSLETGNFLIEVYHYGKPSGLITTRADYWVFYDATDFFWITPNQLKNIILVNGFPLREFIGKGDEVPKKAYLVPKEFVIEKSLRMNIGELGNWM